MPAPEREAPFRRARTDRQREERRAQILATAAAMLAHTSVADLSLNSLAREVGLAKSNVLRYFGSREAVLLELYERETRAWLDALEERLDRDRVASGGTVSPHGDADIEAVARAIAETAAQHPVFCDLSASAFGVLERNVSADVAANYKRSALVLGERLGALVEGHTGRLPGASLMTLAGGVTLIVGGVWQMTQPSVGMAAAYAAHPELAAMHRMLDGAAQELVATLLVGLRYRGSSSPPAPAIPTG